MSLMLPSGFTGRLSSVRKKTRLPFNSPAEISSIHFIGSLNGGKQCGKTGSVYTHVSDEKTDHITLAEH